MRYNLFIWAPFFACLLIASQFDTLKGADEEAAIRKKVEAYIAAFKNRDAKALGSLWAEDAEYIQPETGVVYKGRREIEKYYQGLFEQQKNARLEINVDSITFPSSSQAIEIGSAKVTLPGEEPDLAIYKAIYTKKNGDWLLSQVREIDTGLPPKENEHLQALKWLIGEWVDEDEDSKIVTKSDWDKYKNFLTMHFVVTVEGKMVLEGKEIIGWDPIQNKIRSWVFDSDGGFGEGTWRKEGNTWVVESKQILDDGRRASSINVYTPMSENSFKWESTGREVGGELLPNLGPVTVERKKG